MHYKKYINYKKLNITIIICLFFLFDALAIAQTNIRIKGKVIENKEGKPVRNAKIFIDVENNPVDLTRADGTYEVTTTRGFHKVIVKKIWYRDGIRTIMIRGKIFECNFELMKVRTAKLGAVFPMTGINRSIGEQQKNTINMLADEVNSAGGIAGHKLEIVIYNSQGDAKKAKKAVEQLISKDKVVAITGPSLNSTSLAVLPLAEKYNTPMISCATTNKIAYNPKTKEPYKWVFNISYTNTIAVESIYTRLKNSGISKIAIMSVNSEFGTDARRELIRIAPDYGIQIIADEQHGPKDADIIAQLTKIKNKSPDAIINWSAGPIQVFALNNRNNLNMLKTPFYMVGLGFGGLNLNNLKITEDATEKVYFPIGTVNIATLLPKHHPQKAVTMKYLKDYRNKYGERVTSYGGYTWDAFYLLLDAIKKVGPDKTEIRNYLEAKRDFVGQTGIYNFSKKDHNGLSKNSLNFVTIKENNWFLVE